MSINKPHWEKVSEDWQRDHPQALWRRHCDNVNLTLLKKWWPHDQVDSVLKTDLFDEVFGNGLYPFTRQKESALYGIDLSESIVSAARKSFSDIEATVSDVRQLPFADDTYDLIISNSTLDHFESKGDIAVSLRELYRVLKPGGHLLVTLDNISNPVIALRQVLPFKFLNATGILPYYVGATLGPRGLCREVRQAGFNVIETTSIMHCPRIIAVAVAGLLQRHAGRTTQDRYLRFLMAIEKLAGWPTRNFTGYFTGVKAVK